MSSDDQRPELTEIFALLTARTIPFEVGHRNERHPAALRGAEFAALAARTSPAAWALIQYRYLGDRSVRPKLVERVRRRCAHALDEEGWLEATTRAELLDPMIDLAIYECLDAPVCRRCQGRREVFVGPRVVRCLTCAGTGRAQLRHAQRAAALKRTRQAWAKCWAERYSIVLPEVTDYWLNRVHYEIVAKLRREACFGRVVRAAAA